MSFHDLGDVVTLSVNVKDANLALANATAMTLTITLPDGTTTTPSISNTVTGVYTATYTPTMAGRHVGRWVATGTNAGAYFPIFTVVDPSWMPIVGLEDIKTHLNITTTTDDEELRRVLATASDIAERYTNRALRRQSVTETYNGGSSVIFLRRHPVVSITSVTEDGTALAASDYVLDPNPALLYRGTSTSRSRWADGIQVVSVTYVAGYADPPLVAQQAVLELARHLWQTQRGSVALPTLGGPDDYTGPTGFGWSIPNRVRELLAPLVVPGIA